METLLMEMAVLPHVQLRPIMFVMVLWDQNQHVHWKFAGMEKEMPHNNVMMEE